MDVRAYKLLQPMMNQMAMCGSRLIRFEIVSHAIRYDSFDVFCCYEMRCDAQLDLFFYSRVQTGCNEGLAKLKLVFATRVDMR